MDTELERDAVPLGDVSVSLTLALARNVRTLADVRIMPRAT